MIVIDTDVLIWLLRGNEKVKEMFSRNSCRNEGKRKRKNEEIQKRKI